VLTTRWNVAPVEQKFGIEDQEHISADEHLGGINGEKSRRVISGTNAVAIFGDASGLFFEK
jgi:hypothetical protein